VFLAMLRHATRQKVRVVTKSGQQLQARTAYKYFLCPRQTIRLEQLMLTTRQTTKKRPLLKSIETD